MKNKIKRVSNAMNRSVIVLSVEIYTGFYSFFPGFKQGFCPFQYKITLKLKNFLT